jgi:hypothetical protein
MALRRAVAALALPLMLAACLHDPHQLSSTYLDRYAEPNPVPADFRECHGFACSEVSRVSLSPHEWKRVTAVFSPRPRDAKAERRQIAHAVSLTRQMVGAKTGTGVHQWTHKNLMILPNLGDLTQLDCIDEAVNTWTYTTMMERAGLFHFHRVAQLAYGGTLTDVNARNAAVLQENGGGYFAVDPSLVDFAAAPPVIPLETWLGSWPPDLSATHALAFGS